MKRMLIAVLCLFGIVPMIATVKAAGMCVVEAEGCRDLQTGKLYVRSGNKYIDPETNEVFMENEPVRIPAAGKQSDIRVPRTPVRTMPEPPRDPVTGRIIQPGKNVFVQETEQTEETITGGSRVVPIIGGGGRMAIIPSIDEKRTTTRTYTRATTCEGLKAEINSLHGQWSSRKDWDRAEVGARIDNLEAQYRSDCR